jgi:beta-glucosidase
MTWDKTMIYDQLKGVGLEFYGKGFQVINGPTSQPLGRTAWGGRLVETFGPDPYLNGIAFGIGARAFKDAGCVSGGKHFLLNEQETNRQASGSSSVAPYSSNADDKTIHETYLWYVEISLQHWLVEHFPNPQFIGLGMMPLRKGWVLSCVP